MIQFRTNCSSWVLMHPRSVTPIVRVQKVGERCEEFARLQRQEQAKQQGRFYAQA